MTHKHCEKQLYAIYRSLQQPGPYAAGWLCDSSVFIVMARGSHGLGTFLVLPLRPLLLKFHNCLPSVLEVAIGVRKEIDSVFNCFEI